MNLSKIIGVASAGLAVYFYKQFADLQDESDREKKDREAYLNAVLREKEELEDRIDPDTNAYQSPIVFTASVRAGGQLLEQNEIILECTNPTDSIIELADFQSRIWIAGYMAELCIPSNLSSIKILPKRTVSYRLYARFGYMYRNVGNVKRALNRLYDGKDQSLMRKNTFIPLSKAPVLLNIQYLWIGKGFEDKCYDYNIPGSYRWKFAGWVPGAKAGYNAADENEVERNPNAWPNTTKIESGNE